MPEQAALRGGLFRVRALSTEGRVMKQNDVNIDQQANAVVNALRARRSAHMPPMRFHQWPQFISTVRALMLKHD